MFSSRESPFLQLYTGMFLNFCKKLLILQVNACLTNTIKVRSSVLSPSKPKKKSDVVDHEVLSTKLVRQIVDTVKGQLEIEMKTVISDTFKSFVEEYSNPDFYAVFTEDASLLFLCHGAKKSKNGQNLKSRVRICKQRAISLSLSEP